LQRESDVLRYPIFLSFAAFQLIVADSAYAGAWGVGKASCAEFARLYKMDSDKTEDLFFSWAQGFISGMEVYSEAFDKYEKLPAGTALAIESTKGSIMTYCDKHPLLPYYMAVFDTYNHLPASHTK
jgi:hypothetical protein